MSVWRVRKGLKIVESAAPEYRFDGAEFSIVRSFSGHMPMLVASRPKIGATVAGTDSAFTVREVTIAGAGGGGLGIMTVSLSRPTYTAEKESGSSTEPTFEIEWTEVDKPIESHPKFASIDPIYLDLVQAFFATTDPEERANIKARINDEDALALIEKKLRGTDSYVIYVPIARKTTEVLQPLLTGACGALATEAQIGFSLPAGYSWMKSAARCTRTGKKGAWLLQEEWTGLTAVDEDLYPVLEAP